MVTLVSPEISGWVSAGKTSVKLGEANGLVTLDIFAGSSFSSAWASATCQSFVSDARVSFHELVVSGNSTEMLRGFSMLKKSLFNHGSGFGWTLSSGSETTASDLAPLPAMT